MAALLVDVFAQAQAANAASASNFVIVVILLRIGVIGMARRS